MDQSPRASLPVADILGAIDPSQITDPAVRALVVLLLNVVEDQQRQIAELRAENQRLRDEINRLKGEQGKPPIKGNTPKPPPANYSSEQQRRTPTAWAKSKKLDQVRIDREQTLDVDPTTLPADAEFKGYDDVVVQDLVLRTDPPKAGSSTRRSTTRRAKGRATWPPCRRATGASSGPGSRP